jgi:hypothetical protein
MTNATRRKPAAPSAPPTPAPHPFAKSRAAFIDALRQAADHLAMRGEPEPGLPDIVRVAASELERRYAEDVWPG